MSTPPPIHISSLELDLRGVPPALAQDALASLGPALELALTEQITPIDAHVERGTASTIRLGPGADASTLRDTLARSIARAIASQLPQTDSL